MSIARLFEARDVSGRFFDIEASRESCVIPSLFRNSISSMYVCASFWITFWEGEPFNEMNDSLWVAPLPKGQFWLFRDLHKVGRPHGNNHWGNQIRAVSWSGPPDGSSFSRTIVESDGTICIGESFIFLDVIDSGVISVVSPGLDLFDNQVGVRSKQTRLPPIK